MPAEPRQPMSWPIARVRRDRDDGNRPHLGAPCKSVHKLYDLPLSFQMSPGMPVNADIRVGQRWSRSS